MNEELLTVVRDELLAKDSIDFDKLRRLTSRYPLSHLDRFFVGIHFDRAVHLQIVCRTVPDSEMKGIYCSKDREWILLIGASGRQIQRAVSLCGKQLQLLRIQYPMMKFQVTPHQVIESLDISHLINLRHLEISRAEKLSQLKGLQNMRKLEWLYLHDTAIGPSLDLSHMRSLQRLWIPRNSYLTQVTGMKELKLLRELDLSGSPVQTALDLDGCINLETVEISRTKIDTVRLNRHLTALSMLSASYSQLKDVSFLKYCPAIQMVSLRGCPISRLPSLLENTRLEHLSLEMTPIQSLDGVDLPLKLRRLDLSGTKITSLPDRIEKLKKLIYLDLCGLHLTELPCFLADLGMDFWWEDGSDWSEKTKAGFGICLYGTKIRGVDMSIFAQDQDVIRRWFEEQKRKDGTDLNEVKVVFLGDGEAGKTHTINRLLKSGELLDRDETPEDATPGIVITDKFYRIGDRDVQVHFWDFGGQEILHSMHRIFLTERTLYVVLLNARDNTQDERARYWLHNIRSFAGNAPVLLVLNKTDQNEYATVNISDLRRLSPGLPEAVRLSALRDSPEDFNRKLTGAMLDAISRIDTINTFFPNSWKQVKNALQTMQTPYIRGDAYKRLCDEHRVDGSIQKSVLDLFKTLGVSFYYPGAKLEDYVVLRPDWITNAIYIILFNKRKEVENGLISHETIFRLLNPRAGDTVKRVLPDAVYRPEEINYVLDVVRRFRLSYLVEDGMEFIPMLCAGNSLPVAEEYEKALDTLEFRMVYDYLPNNVIHRLMVELRQHLDQTNVWLTGARFREASKGFSAVVKTEGNLLRIFVRAEKDRYTADMYLDTIRDALERINDTMGLKVAENQVVYKADGIVECFDYDDLLLSLELGDTMVASRKLRRKIPIADVLSQTDHQVDADRAALIGHLLSACRKLQSNSMYWDAREDDRNTYIRDLLRTQGYLVFDQTLCGASASGKQAGELDLEIRREQDMPWTIFEALNLSGKGKTQMAYWDGHLQKLLDNYNAHGLPFLFHVSYVACGKDQFSGVCGACADHLRFHSPEPYSLQFTGPLRTMPKGYGENHFLQAYQCVYDCNGFPTTVYHIFVRLGA